MAEVYHRPLAAFFLSTPTEETDSVTDFRLLSGNHVKSWSPELHRSFRRVRMQREVAIELAELRAEEPRPIEQTLRLDFEPDDAGDQVRAWLGVPSMSLFSTENLSPGFNAWIALIERKAVLVAQVQGIDLDEMRGLSISEQPFPMIVLNGKDAPAGKLFTLLHELIHVLLRAGGLLVGQPFRR